MNAERLTPAEILPIWKLARWAMTHPVNTPTRKRWRKAYRMALKRAGFTSIRRFRIRQPVTAGTPDDYYNREHVPTA